MGSGGLEKCWDRAVASVSQGGQGGGEDIRPRKAAWVGSALPCGSLTLAPPSPLPHTPESVLRQKRLWALRGVMASAGGSGQAS